MSSTGKVKARWTRSFLTNLNTQTDEGRCSCDICQNGLASPSNPNHRGQVHVIASNYHCEPYQVAFHSLGHHLQKHRRNSAHGARSQMTQAFGLATSANPRPYGCPECDTAFRKHGHLAKHLRSKSHITRLESRGLIPSGTHAALERSGQNLKDRLVTINYEQSLVSMREIAAELLQNQMMYAEPPPPPPPQAAAPVSSYGPLGEPTGGGGASGSSNIGTFDNHANAMMAHFASSSAQPQPILSPGHFSSSSLSPPLVQQAAATRMGPHSSGLPAANMAQLDHHNQQQQHHQHHQHHHSTDPVAQDQAMFQHQLTAGVVYPNGPAHMMIADQHNMMPQHPPAAHSLDYTLGRHQYQH